ncbi:MAG: T9SS type A sorting domain-containing protein [Chitinophagales bacterium]
MKSLFVKFLVFLLFCFSAKGLLAQNINLSNEEDFNGEPFLAIDPTDEQHVAVAWMGLNGLNLIQIHLRVSFDGGESWNEPHLFSHLAGYNTSADPSIDFDSDGNLYVCFIDYHISGTTGGVYIYKSEDGGITFNEPVEVIHTEDDLGEYPVDRPWMVIDKSGTASDGNIYVTTKPAPWEPIPNRSYFIASTDGGLSFNDWKYIDATGWSIGSFISGPMITPSVSADGIFYCIYPSFEITESFYPRFICAKTYDAGESFEYFLVKESTTLNSDTVLKLGYLLITDDTNPLHLAFLYILSSFGDPDIFLNESFDGGETWSDDVRVNDDTPSNDVSQDLVWADFDQGGNLLVTWRDRRNAPDTGSLTSYEIYSAVKWKDSTSFSNNLIISDELIAFDDVLKENGNDFMGCVFANDTVYAAWGDTRNGFLNIWFTKMNAKTATGTGVQNLNSRQTTFIYPNPAVIDEPVFVNSIKKEEMLVIIYNVTGKLVMQKRIYANEPFYIEQGIEPGCYFYSIDGRENGEIIFNQ